MTKKVHLLLFLFLCLITATGNAQVTIGSGKDPIKGAILDIREKDASELITSTRGVMLPRVDLVSPTALAPMLANPDDAPSKLTHIGLTVYNMNNCLLKTGYDRGVYIWTGTKWQPIINKPTSSNVQTFTDQDSNSFRAAKFGSAGIWMVDNLRAKKYDTKVVSPPVFPATPDVASDSQPRWSYPVKNTENGTNSAYLDSQNTLGLLYNWHAATANKNTVMIDQGQPYATPTPQSNEVEVLFESVAGAKDGKIQGICPNGWHIPSDREWNDLEREIHNNASKYSSYTSTPSDFDGYPFSPWNLTWEYGADTGISGYENAGIGFRPKGTNNPGHGYAMVSPCEPITSTTNATGKSLSPDQGGFNVNLIGFMDTKNPPLGMKSVGKYGYIWASSRMPSATTSNDNVLRRSWAGQPNEGGVYRRVYLPDAAYFSVRCKKDMNDFTLTEPPYVLLCGTGLANGAYVKGRALVSNENTITIKFNAPASSAGNTINLSTNTVDGISFAGTATIQAGGGMQEATLNGNGTPNTDDDKVMTLTTSGIGYTTTCAVNVEMVRPALRVLFLGDNNGLYHYNFNPDEDSSPGHTWRMINTSTNFGNQNNSKVKTDGIIRIASAGGGTNETDAFIKQHLIDNPVDMVVVSYNNMSIRTNATQRSYFKEFMAKGGTAIINQESTATDTQTFLREVLNDNGIIVKSGGGAGTLYTFQNTNHEILNGPFGDIKAKNWGEDASVTLAARGFAPGTVTPLSLDYNPANSGTPNGSYTTFVHNTMNFIWTGDGGFNSDEKNNSNTICPFRIVDGTNYPTFKSGYGNVSIANRTEVYNAVFTANVFAYAIKKVYEKKAQQP